MTTTSLFASFTREIAAGLPRLAGTRIAGTIPLTEQFLNELIPQGTPVSDLRLLDDEQFTVKVSIWNVASLYLLGLLLRAMPVVRSTVEPLVNGTYAIPVNLLTLVALILMWRGVETGFDRFAGTR